MRIWITWVLVGWFALLPTTVLAEAQDWAAVQQLQPGSRLQIRVPVSCWKMFVFAKQRSND